MQEANTIKEAVSPESSTIATNSQVCTAAISPQETAGAPSLTPETEQITTTIAEAAVPTSETNKHPNQLKMAVAYQLIINDPEFYKSDSKVHRYLEASKLPDPAPKLWKTSLTNARKELNDKAMEWARTTNSAVVIPTEDEITNLACDKFRDSWRKVGKGKPLPALPLSV